MTKNALWLNVPLAMLTFAATAMAVVVPLNNRSYVSNIGSDANTCTFARPCATFQRAYAQTVVGGEVDVQNDGEYGPIVIQHAFTIDGEGSMATITVPQGSNNAIAIAINAPAAAVLIRNLSLSGGPQGLGFNTIGVGISSASSVVVQNLSLDQFDFGISNGDVGGVTSPGTNHLLVQDTAITNCDDVGVLLFNTTGGSGSWVSVLKNVSITMVGTSTGILGDGPGVAGDVVDSTVSGGSVGVEAEQSAELHLLRTTVQYATNSGTGVGVFAPVTGGSVYVNACLISNNDKATSWSESFSSPNYTLRGAVYTYGNNQLSNNAAVGGALTFAFTNQATGLGGNASTVFAIPGGGLQ